MANRIVMGERSGQYGLWVSKPGFNVLTTGQENMLLSMGEDSLQAVHTATISMPTNVPEVSTSIPISIPYTPLVLMQLTPRAEVYVDEVGNQYLERYTPRYRMLSSTSIGFSMVGVPAGAPPLSLTFTVFLKELYG